MSYTLMDIRNLTRQLERGPRRLCLRHLGNINFLASMIDDKARYPLDFVWRTITGVHLPPAAFDAQSIATISGGDLRQDLASMAEDLSQSARLPAAACRTELHSPADLAERLGVSLKTISRWRKRGLITWRVVDDGGRLRTVVPDPALRVFVAANMGLVQRAASFAKVDDQERATIVARAAKLAERRRMTISALAQTIASETGRGRETIRTILKQHCETNAHGPVLVSLGMSDAVPAASLQLWEAYQDGATVQSLSERTGMPVAEVYAAITEMRARELLGHPIEYIDSDEFRAADAADRILNDAAADAPYAPDEPRRIPKGLPPYLRDMCNLPLLHPAGESALFRRMNYLKYVAQRMQDELAPESATAHELDQLEMLLDEADRIRQQITRANLRLVVHVAKQHSSARNDIFELISDGNVALIRAVDLFDYARGFKFSTYASWSVMRRLARHNTDQMRHSTRYRTGHEDLENLAPTTESEPGRATAPVVHDLLGRIQASLSSRQWRILQERYGLGPAREPRTLAQIGARLGVSRERVRQIEAQTLEKLRTDFGAEVADLLN